jgi:D-erythrulose 1-phosphate 3-epimerase
MTEILLGVNNCFALGRYPEPEEWLRIVKNELGLDHVQFSYDIIDPIIIDQDIFVSKCKYIKNLADNYGVFIDTAITGEAVHKFNGLMEPDPAIRSCYLHWYDKMIRAGSLLGAEGAGVYLGTLSKRDNADPYRRKYMIDVLLEEISYLTMISKEVGQKYFLWEPMSIPREIPSTIDETKEIIERANQISHVPVKLCLDVGHGYIKSGDQRDSDAYAWLKEFASISPAIHMQQTDGKGSRRWPFSEEYNKIGVIKPEKVFEKIEESGAKKIIIVFEFFYSAHAIQDESALDNLKISVEYWKKAIKKVYG